MKTWMVIFLCAIAYIVSGACGFNLSCTNEIFLKLNGSTITTLCTFRGTQNETIDNATLLTGNNQCNNMSLRLTLKIKKPSNFSNGIILIKATNISWDLDGPYVLKVVFSNGSADTRTMILHVLDYPVMPDTNYKFCNDTNSLCFQLSLPTINSKNSFRFAHFSFNHSVESKEQRCSSYVQKGWVPCKLNKEINPPAITCKIQSLDICKDKNVLGCLKPYYMNIYGVNNAGLSRSIRFQLFPPFKVIKSHRVVKEMSVQALSSTQLKIFWKRPKCKYMEFVYRPTYTLLGADSWTRLETTLSDSFTDVGHNFKQDIKGLKPYTNYTVCIESYDEVLGLDFIKGACITKQTLEAAPSKAPSKITPRPISTGKDTWACEIVWEGVPRDNWNGVVKSTIIAIRKNKRPNSFAKPKIFVPIEKTRYRIEGLSKNVDYLVVLKLCTKGGCTSTKEMPISIKKNEQSQSLSTSKVISMVVGSSVVVMVVTLVVAFSIKSCMNRTNNNRHRRLSNSAEHLNHDEIPDIEVINPRNATPNPNPNPNPNEGRNPVAANRNFPVLPDWQDLDRNRSLGTEEHVYEEIPEDFIRNNSYEGASSIEAFRDDESFAQLQRTDGEEGDSESLELRSEISSRTYSIETDPLMPIA